MTTPTGPATPSPTTKAPRPGDEIAWRDAVMHLYKPTDPTLGTIVKTESCTAAKKSAGFVRHIEIDVSGTTLVGQCQPGQSVGVLPPGVDANAKPHKLRLYSLASPAAGEDGAGKIISTTVKRTIDEHWETGGLFLGVCSNFLCDAKPGDKVSLTGPSGKKFILPKDPADHDFLFFATGTGIAPFRGMVIDLLRHSPRSRVALVMGSPYATDLLYHAFFQDLARTHANFSYHTAVSREDNQGLGKLYVQDRLRTDADTLVPMLTSGRTLIYVCGIAGMELGILQQLARTLQGSALDHYMQIDPAIRDDLSSWNRSMLHKQIHLTRKVLLEVYA